MKIQLRHLKTNETLHFEISDASTLHDLRLLINESMPSSVQLSINRDDELLGVSSQATLRSLGVKPGDLIYYSLDPSDFNALISTSLTEARKTPAPGSKLTENETLVQELETNQALFSDSTSAEVVETGSVPKSKNQESKDVNLDGRKRLSEPLFLKKLLDESGDACEWRIVIMSVHAVMLESGFVMLDPDSGIIFKDQILSISRKYTLPDLIRANEPDGVKFVSLKFQRLGHLVVLYGSLGVGSLVRRVCFDERKYVHIVELLMGTLESDKEEDTLSIHRKVFMWWRMIKDGVVTPLLIDLCYNASLDLPPCFMYLLPELKRNILASLPGVNIARMACVSRELRDLVYDDKDLWKQKCMEEFQDFVVDGNNVTKWKEQFAFFELNHSWLTKLKLGDWVRDKRNPK